MNTLFAIREVTLLSAALRIFLSALLGGILGLDRGMKNRPAGLRTFMLVCMGSAIVMLTNQYIYQAFNTGDPARLGAQVISGIGFIGAGTIIVTAKNQIKGLTTAAGLWACACVGLAIGIGLYEIAVLSTVCIYLVLALLHSVDYRMRKLTRQLDVYCELAAGTTLHQLIDYTREQHFKILDMQLQREETGSSGMTALTITLKADGPHKCNHDAIMERMRRMEGMAYIEEL